MKKAVLRAVFPGFLCVESLCLFAVLYAAIIKDVSNGHMKWYALVIGAVFILPSVVFFLLTRKTYLGRISGIRAAVISCVSAVIIGMLCLAILFWIGFNGVKYEYTTDPADYSEKYELSSVVHGIFPEEIPANAENVIFDYGPPSWQGERHLMLMYDTDDAAISAVEESADFMNLWEIDSEDRKYARILLRSYFDIESAPDDKINIFVVDSKQPKDSTFIAIVTMPNEGKVAYIYYVD